MKVTFTKCIYEDYEVDIPLREYQERFNDCKEEAVLEYMHDACKVGEEVGIDDIDLGKLDNEDEDYLQELYDQQDYEDRLQNSGYLESLI